MDWWRTVDSWKDNGEVKHGGSSVECVTTSGKLRENGRSEVVEIHR